MLARLISAGQVVLVYYSGNIYLFYRGQVYSRPMASGLEGLPEHCGMVYCPIWALVDADYEGQGPQAGSSPGTWPVQVTSPNPIRWKSWSKQNGATLLGMPLWNMEELMEGYVFSLFSLSAIDPGYFIR